MRGFLKALLILAVLSALIPARLHAAVVDKIKAVINNEVITQSEIDRLLYPIYLRYKNIYKGGELDKRLEEAETEILDQLINDRLLLSEARKQGIEVDKKEIDQKMETLKAKFSGEDNLMSKLNEQNLTIPDLERQYRDQIMIDKLIDSQIRHQIQILPQEAENYYQQHIKQFTQPEQARVSAILIRTQSERTQEESITLAMHILNRLKSGDDFYTLARNYSEGMNAEQGGDMGYVRKGQMIEKIDRAIFNLNIGEFSDIVETSLGYHIFKVYDRKRERAIPLLEARPHIMDAIYRNKVEARFKEWLEELKKNAFISIK